MRFGHQFQIGTVSVFNSIVAINIMNLNYFLPVDKEAVDREQWQNVYFFKLEMLETH